MKENYGLTRPSPSLQLTHSHDVVFSAVVFSLGGSYVEASLLWLSCHWCHSGPFWGQMRSRSLVRAGMLWALKRNIIFCLLSFFGCEVGFLCFFCFKEWAVGVLESSCITGKITLLLFQKFSVIFCR